MNFINFVLLLMLLALVLAGGVEVTVIGCRAGAFSDVYTEKVCGHPWVQERISGDKQ